MPNDSILVRKAIMQRDLLGKSFFDKKKKDLAEIDAFLKESNDPDYKKAAQKHRDSVATRGYTKEEIDARVKRAKMQSMKAGL
jgi:hypothetical protein